MKNKLRMIQIIFNIENWLRKSNFGTFWHVPNPQNSIINWYLGKNLSNFVPPAWKLHNPYCNIFFIPIHVSMYARNWNLMIAIWAISKIGQPIKPILLQFFALICSYVYSISIQKIILLCLVNLWPFMDIFLPTT